MVISLGLAMRIAVISRRIFDTSKNDVFTL
jgi:hypothetical protein